MGMIQLPKQFNPDFAVPGKKPVGPVEIDFRNPITRGLSVCVVKNELSGQPQDLVSESLMTLGNTSTSILPAWVVEQGVSGMEFKPPDTTGDEVWLELPASSSIGTKTDFTDLTILSVFKQDNSTASNFRALASRRGDSGYQYHFRSLGNRLSLLMTGGSQTMSGSALSTGVIYTGLCTRDSSGIVLSVDGNEESFATKTVTSRAEPFRIGGTALASPGFTGWDGDIFLTLAWNRALTSAERKSISDNPYQILKPVNAPVYFPAAAAGGGITGTADFTLAGLTTTSSGDVDIIGTSDITLDALTTTSAGSIDVEGTSSITFDSLTVTGQGTVDVDGTSDITFDTLTTTGQGFVGNPPAIGTADFTLAALTTTSLGTVDVSGTSDNTFDALTTTTAGSVDVEGASSNTFDGLSLSSSGAVAVEGTSSNTFADLTLTGQGTTATIALGTADFTFDGLTVTSVGDVAVEGTSSANLDSLTTTTNATVSITGTSSNTLDALTVTASASGLSLPRIDGLFNQVINTDGGSVRMYFNGTDYFTL